MTLLSTACQVFFRSGLLVIDISYTFFSEPVGSVGPKVDMEDKFGVNIRESNNSLNLLCKAQGYPMPAFR